MNNRYFNSSAIFVYAIIVVAVLSRLVPHTPNVAAVTALAIFSAVYLPQKQAIAIPLLVRFVSDAIIGFFYWPLMVAVYLAHGVGLLLGWWIRKSVDKPLTKWAKIFFSGGASAVAFFLITNFALLYPAYPHSWQGIILAYTNGLPFLRGTLIGDVGYVVALFGAYELAKLAVRMVKKRNVIFTD